MAMPLYKVNNHYHPPALEELQLIQKSIILPLALVVVERNRRELDRKARSLRAIFAKAADIIILRMKADLAANTQLLVSKSIAVCTDNGTHNKLTYRFNCRGYEDRLTLTHEYIRNEINKQISAYNSELFAKHASTDS
ncbi:hypothetical protein [Paenibacillus sp. LHD-38]|uniref:hypothetical protein n=1 Tax=Paenibacillus sp. LHD-38 TaxID=3072143 RepID=UPI00280F9025|nr:hypothetical protein [Paenibacillus sp. LHD-38]MDQ8737522.1 hypothetical protein [Paenibacillus sp. LHD-38]